MPPSLLEWVDQDHLVWMVLDSVGELDLSAFYAAYRLDGRARPAYDPGDDGRVVDVCVRAREQVLAADRARVRGGCGVSGDHREPGAGSSTIAEFRVRHEQALAELFGGVLELCKQAGLVSVGVIAVDGTKVIANASSYANVDYKRIAREILEEAARIDREEDELYGEARGDELPEHLRTPEGRRAALKEAKQRLDEERQRREREEPQREPLPVRELVAPAVDENQGALFCLRLQAQEIVDRSSGRRGWLRAARQQLDQHREHDARPVSRSRIDRLLEAERRLSEELEVEREANRIYEAYRQRGVMKDGRRFGGPPKPYVLPEEPEGKVNLSDPDCRLQKVRQGWVQGYNAQAVANEQQIVLAAEITVDSPDFGHLGPMIKATERELENVGIAERPKVIVADAGYWHQEQMDELVSRGMQVLIPPDAKKRKGARAGWTGGAYAWMRTVLAHEPGRGLYNQRSVMIEPVFADEKYNRRIDRFQRRGRAAVSSEWRLINATHNLLKLHRHRLAAATG